MTEEKFQKLRDFFLDAVTIGKDDHKKAIELSRSQPSLYQSCIGFVKDQATETNNFNILLEEYHGKLYTKFIKDDPRNLSHNAINAMIECDPVYTKLKIELRSQTTMLNFFEATIINIKSISFQVKNYIDLKKFFDGSNY